MPEIGRLLRPDVLTALSITPWILFAYLAFTIVTAGLTWAAPVRYRKPLLLVASLAFGWLFLDPVIALVVLGVTLALFVISRWLPPGRPRVLAAAALLAFVFLPFCFSGIPIERALIRSQGWPGQLVLLMVFFKRAIYFAYELHHGRIRRPSLVDFLVSFISLPFLLGRAPVVAYTHLHDRYRPVDAKALWSGSRTVLFALLHLAALGLLAGRFIHVPMDAPLAHAAVHMPWAELAMVLGLNYLAFYLFRYSHEQISVGAARLLGFAIDDNYANPLASTDYADFWRRWNIHFRQMLVSMFYYPVALRLSRRFPRRKKLNVIGACIAVFTVHGLFMLYTMGMFIPLGQTRRWGDLALSLLLYELLQVVLTAGSLLLLGRAHRTGRWRWIGVPLGISVTFVLRALMLLLIWRRSMGLPAAAVVFLALMP